MKRGDFAYLPGTGPEEKTCNDCIDIHVVSKKNGKCHKAAELRRVSVLVLDVIPLNTAACKYWAPQDAS